MVQLIMYTKSKTVYIFEGGFAVKNKLFRIIGSIICTAMLFNTFFGVSATKAEPVEVESLRTEYEKHFRNPDGTVTAIINTTPIHYLNNGKWEGIDNTLIQLDNAYTNKSNSLSVTLASETSLRSGNGSNSPKMVQIVCNGYSIAWDMTDVANNLSRKSNIFFKGKYSYSAEIRFYKITKDVNVYDYGHSNGHSSTSTGVTW